MSYMSYSVIWCGDLSCTLYSASFCTRNESRIFCQSTTHWVLEHTAEHGYSCHSRSRPVYKSPCASGNIQTGNSSHHWQEIGASWLKTLELSARFHPDAHRWAWPVQWAIMIESTGATSTRVDRRCGAQHVKVTQIPDSTSLSGPGSGFCTVVVITALHQNSKTARNSRHQSQSSFELISFYCCRLSQQTWCKCRCDDLWCANECAPPSLRKNCRTHCHHCRHHLLLTKRKAWGALHERLPWTCGRWWAIKCQPESGKAAATIHKTSKKTSKTVAESFSRWKNIMSCAFPSVLRDLTNYSYTIHLQNVPHRLLSQLICFHSLWHFACR